MSLLQAFVCRRRRLMNCMWNSFLNCSLRLLILDTIQQVRRMTGDQIFHEMMRRHSMKHVFEYPAGTILPVFDTIYNSPIFDFILPNHKRGAGHMAEGYARASGKPGVVLVTSGPGATNVITPIQNTLYNRTPLAVFCDQVATSVIGSDTSQEADISGISCACNRWNIMVQRTF